MTGLRGHRGLRELWNAAAIVSTLGELGRCAEPVVIRELLPFGLSRSRVVRDAARAAIRYLAALVSVEDLQALDFALRTPTWNLGTDWYELNSNTVRKIELKTEDDHFFLCILASHHSGFIREAAIRAMPMMPASTFLPFILLRLTDWVKPVRDLAEQAFVSRLTPDNAGVLVDCLGLIDRIKKRERFSPEIDERIDALLRSPECRDELFRGMAAPSVAVRERSFSIALRHAPMLSPGLVMDGLRDRAVQIRKAALMIGLAQLPHQSADFIDQALTDSCAPVRRVAFEFLLKGDASVERLLPILLDRSPSIRHQCQSAVGKIAAEFYTRSLQNSQPQSLAVAIAGLAGTVGAAAAPAISPFLDSPSVRVRCAALRALNVFSMPPDQKALTAMLVRDSPSIGEQAAKALLRNSTIESVWALAVENPNPQVRGRVLKLLRKEGKWSQLRIFLKAVADTDDGISARASMMLNSWWGRFNRSFAQPSASDRRTLPELLEAATPRLSRKDARAFASLLDSALR